VIEREGIAVEIAPQPKARSDGSWTSVFQRPLSRRLVPLLDERLSANVVTGLAGLTGLFAAALAALAQPIPSALLIQAFGLLSCADGEVARRRREASPLGDFLDTLSDRLVEVAMIAGTATLMVREGLPSTTSLAACLGLQGSVLMLVVSSEKYRSSHGDYPKQARERGWAWVSAGSDARLLVLSLGLFAAAWAPSVLLAAVVALTVVSWANFAWRVRAMARDQVESE
jgi:phosphatidylglycerophosphate synthase